MSISNTPKHGSNSKVSLIPISQATKATFTDLYIQLTILVFIQVGSKRVVCPIEGELIGEAGNVVIFSPGSLVTMENRPILDAHYRAMGVCFPHSMVEAVFSPEPSKSANIQLLQTQPNQSQPVLTTIQATLTDTELPEPIGQHRLLEPLIWLKHHGIHLTSHHNDHPLSHVRQLIETDLSHQWRSPEVAEHFSISEATMRRWLAKSGQSFSKILKNTRLEKGLSLLQSTEIPISDIALDCGFKTPSHFADSFRQRFGIKPSEIRTVEG